MDATDTNERDPLLDADTLLGDSSDGDEDEHLDAEAFPDHGAGQGPAQGPAQIGRFVVLQRLGEGGMGVVYAAYDNELDRKLAIKLVRPERAAADTRVRVKREAKAMARLSHPNVVHVYEVGEFEEQIYVAMEFVTGPTLGAWVRGLEPPGSPPAHSSREPRWQTILEVYIQAGRGLEAAHAAGIVHRDFKPENAILGEDGRVRVLDFGIARGTAAPAREPGPHPATASASGLGSEPASATSGASSSVGSSSGVIVRSGDSAEALPEDLHAAGLLETAVATDQTDPLSTPLTMTGAWVGTPAYMSPEQFRGHDIDARSDQFGFAVALYEALYDQRPFAGKNPTALMNNVVGGKILPAPPGSEVPHWLRAHLLRALSVVPGRRWPNMTQLLDALEDNPERRRRRRRRRLAIAGASLLVLSGLGGFANDQWRRAQQAEEARIRAQAEEARAQRAEAEASAARD
ncbi:serine/threonine kinase family protein, partial [Plesiocystis pacifica SIR-1]